MEVVINGEVRTVETPVEVVAAPVPMVDLGYPSYLMDKYFLSGPEYRRDRRNTISTTVSRDWAATRAYLESIGAESLNAKTSFDAYEFIRMVAKIAYCEAIAQLIIYGYPGLESIKENFVLDFIRNGGSPPWQYIGGEPPTAPPEDITNPDNRAVTSSPTSSYSLNSAGLATVWSSAVHRTSCGSGCVAKELTTPNMGERCQIKSSISYLLNVSLDGGQSRG